LFTGTFAHDSDTKCRNLYDDLPWPAFFMDTHFHKVIFSFVNLHNVDEGFLPFTTLGKHQKTFKGCSNFSADD
jgi:hypothetical protein